MSAIEMRPRFRFESPLSMRDIVGKFRHKLQNDNPMRFHASLLDFHIVVKYPKEKRHFWSPQLDISLEENLETGKTLLRCMLAPAPSVWTMFMFFYAVTGFAALIGLMLGISQISLDHWAWGFFVMGGGLIGIVVLWLLAKEGQHLAKDESWQLKQFIDEALDCDCMAHLL